MSFAELHLAALRKRAMGKGTSPLSCTLDAGAPMIPSSRDRPYRSQPTLAAEAAPTF